VDVLRRSGRPRAAPSPCGIAALWTLQGTYSAGGTPVPDLYPTPQHGQRRHCPGKGKFAYEWDWLAPQAYVVAIRKTSTDVVGNRVAVIRS
jgi:hypothetical protein